LISNKALATALALAAAGASIACLSRTASDLETLEAEIKQTSSAPTLFLVRDVLSDPAQIILDVERALGPIDILINNAGITRIGPLYLEKNIDIWWHVQEVNVKAPMALIHACLPSMMKRGSGKIITIGSAAADNSFPFCSAYGASKAALQKAHQCLDIEMRGKGIVFYCIHPCGTSDSAMGEGDGVNMEAIVLPEVQEFAANFAKTALTDTLALAADSIVFLAADKRMEVFSGKYVDCCQDMEDVLQNKDKILSGDFNMLNINRL
jgi:NADP-dependent 3-hydroxy acid dehydrogenase YdfG